MNMQANDYDSPWKEILEAYFEDFMTFFFPLAAEEVDWDKGYTFLDKELQQVVRDAELGKRFVDKLVRVWQRNGDDAWALVHIEVQGQAESAFPKRMYVYNYRIFDRYDRSVASLAVLADDMANWRPDRFGYELFGCKVAINFPVVKLVDYVAKWEELEACENPFAVVVMAHLKTRETRNDNEGRKRWKLHLVRQLYERGYRREDVINLFRFIDWIMRLPDDIEEGFWETISQYEKEKEMRYVTSVERIGIKKGTEQGIQQGILQTAREDILEILDVRFDIVPQTLVERVNRVDDPTILRILLKKAATAVSPEEYAQFMDQIMSELPTQ